ncbi:TolC family protein [Sphingobacterium spiritivorum]|uniref:TolC family protein n=1 Tax=Sphingobacterium spiritivorum TaxID=258 RepID=UPI001918B146|nr:TolC family protein [Sphingobacterium spiritivorum]QQT25546.1 TolC family protein [Sphingobacterium spiritivorum]
MIKHIMATSLFWSAVVVMFPIHAQQQKKHTLGSLWSEVEENYPGVSVRTSAIAAAKFNQRAVKGNMLPQINAQAQNTYGTYEGSAGAFFPQAGFFNVSGSAVPLDGSSVAANTFGSATIQWEVFSFGKLGKQNEAAGALYHKSVSEKDAYVLNLKKTLSERYIILLYNNAKLQWAEKNAERLNDIRKVTAAMSASGLRPAADSLLASSSYVQAMGEHDKWQGFEKAAYIKLLELYGNDTINYTASANRFENMAENRFGKSKIINVSHPVLDALDKQSEYYMLSGEAQERSSLPSINLLGGYAYRGTGINPNGAVSGAWKDGFNNTTSNFLAGIGITWNLTSLHTNRMKGQQLFKEAESTRFLHAQYEQAMQADLSASQAKIIQQYSQLQKTKLAVQQSQDAYHMYRARYKSGLITLSELLQIRILLEQAENAHIEASRDYWVLLVYEAELTADFDFLFNNL